MSAWWNWAYERAYGDASEQERASEALRLCHHGYDQGELCPICNEPEYRAALRVMEKPCPDL